MMLNLQPFTLPWLDGRVIIPTDDSGIKSIRVMSAATIKRFYWKMRKEPSLLFEFIRCAAVGRANIGFCTACDQPSVFVERDTWLREHYHCVLCDSLPRQRALMNVLKSIFPQWKQLRIYEASPHGPVLHRLQRGCPGYTTSHLYKDAPLGASHSGMRCENLEALTFPDAVFDLVITQDVLEHVLDPTRAFSEIARVLTPAGAHVFTVPYYRGRPTLVRAVPSHQGITYLEKPEYHGNPIDPQGSLVVTEWGDDLPEQIFRSSGMLTTIIRTRDRTLGLDGEFLEVFVSRKASVPL
jgi:Methyltransferase domain